MMVRTAMVLISCCWLAALAAEAVPRVPPPPSRGHQEVVVTDRQGRRALLTEPGRWPELPAKPIVQVKALGIAPHKIEEYRQVSPEKALALARADDRRPVRFIATVASVTPAEETSPTGFETTEGLRCVIFLAPVRELEPIARALRSDGPVEVFGRPERSAEGSRVVVDAVRAARRNLPDDLVPWQVVVRGPDGEFRVRAGERRRVALPVENDESRPGGASTMPGSVWYRVCRAVDLRVGGRRAWAELADTAAERSRGLQGRVGLAPDEGMLFWFPRPLRANFVMKTVRFPLSVAFVRPDGRIESIRDLSPGSRREVVSRGFVAHVLEMRQGWFREHGIGPGAAVEGLRRRLPSTAPGQGSSSRPSAERGGPSSRRLLSGSSSC